MLTQEQFDEFKLKVSKDAAEAVQKEMKTAETNLTEAAKKMTAEQFEAFKAEQLEEMGKLLAPLEKASKEQGTALQGILEKGAPDSIAFEDFIVNEFKKVQGTGKVVEFSGEELRKAGVRGIDFGADKATQTTTGTVGNYAAYGPLLAAGMLSIFDVLRNPNFITSKVNMGRTNKAFLPWANEGSVTGAPARVVEGGLKPQVSRNFTISMSEAKKIAAYSIFTEEFLDDLPGFATFTRRKLQEDVYRAFDDAIQEGVQLAARPYEIPHLNGEIQSANYWDALYAMMAQVGYYNHEPNAAAINWLTNVMLKTAKNVNDSYLLPSFAGEVNGMLTYANKMAFRHALVGDLKQYNVDIYKDIYVKMGLINDQLIHNEETIVVEMRYHDYISDARKKAIVYDSLGSVANTINGTPTNSSAS